MKRFRSVSQSFKIRKESKILDNEYFKTNKTHVKARSNIVYRRKNASIEIMDSHIQMMSNNSSSDSSVDSKTSSEEAKMNNSMDNYRKVLKTTTTYKMSRSPSPSEPDSQASPLPIVKSPKNRDGASKHNP